jgi:hypothetical protein
MLYSHITDAHMVFVLTSKTTQQEDTATNFAGEVLLTLRTVRRLPRSHCITGVVVVDQSKLGFPNAFVGGESNKLRLLTCAAQILQKAIQPGARFAKNIFQELVQVSFVAVLLSKSTLV